MVHRRKAQSSPAKPIIIAVVIVVAIIGGWLFVTNQGDADRVVISPNVVVYSEDTSDYSILSCDSDTVTVSSASDGLGVGKILNAGITDETPDGLLRRIVAIEEDDDGYVVFKTEQAALTEAIEKCDISVVATLEGDGTYDVQENDEPDSSFGVEQAFADEGTSDFLSYPKNGSEDNGLKARGSNKCIINLKIENGEIFLSFADRFFIKAQCNAVTLNANLDTIKLKSFDFNVGPVRVVFLNDLSIDFSSDASVESLDYAADASLDKTVGFEYSTREGLKGINEDSSTPPALSFSMASDDASMNLDSALSISLSSRLYGLAGVELTAALDSEAEVSVQAIPEGEETSGAIEMPGIDKKLRGSVFEKITIPISGSFVAGLSRNPFDTIVDLSDLINVELFNTGDLITLLEIDESFGEIVKPYEYYDTEFFRIAIPSDIYPYFSGRLIDDSDYSMYGSGARMLEYSLSLDPPGDNNGGGTSIVVITEAFADALESGEVDLPIGRFVSQQVMAYDRLGEGMSRRWLVEYENGASGELTSNGDVIYINAAGSTISDESTGIIFTVK